MFKIVYPEEIMLARVKVLEAEVEQQRAALRAVRDILAEGRISAEMRPAVDGEKRQMSLDDLIWETGLLGE